MNEALQILVSATDVLVTSDKGEEVQILADAGIEVISHNSGPPGAPGTGSGFLHTQSVASAEWIVNHNLGYRPVVSVYSPGGEILIVQVVHMSVNQCRVYFNSLQTGFVRCT